MTGNKRIGWGSLFAALAALAAPAAALASDGKLPDPAADWNHLFGHVMVDILIIGVVFGGWAAYMLVKYRATAPGQIGQGPKLSVAQAIGLAVIPAVVFMADDFFLAANAWVLWNTQRSVPAGALEIRMTANQFYWDFDFGNGVTATNEIKVPVGKPVVMRMTSSDVVHSFGIPDFRIKEDAVPGRKTFLWFVAQKPGRYLATCGEYCGMSHANMQAWIEAVPQADYDAWIKSQQHASAAPAAQAPNS